VTYNWFIFIGAIVLIGGIILNFVLRRFGKPASPGEAPQGLMSPQIEAIYTGERVTLTTEQARARKRRSQWMVLALFTFVILIFVVTMTKLGANIMVRDL
jgi:hypothetical protein